MRGRGLDIVLSGRREHRQGDKVKQNEERPPNEDTSPKSQN